MATSLTGDGRDTRRTAGTAQPPPVELPPVGPPPVGPPPVGPPPVDLLPVDPLSDPLVTDPTVLPPQTGDLQVAAMRGSWWTALQATIALPITFVVNIVVARSLGPHGYGLLATYAAAFGLVLVVVNAGVSDATIQWGAAAHARGDRTELFALARRSAGFHVYVETPLVVVAVFVILHREAFAAQLVAALAVAVTMLVGTTVVVLTAMSFTAPLARLNLVIGLATQLAVVTAAVQTQAAGPTWAARLAVSALGPVAVLALAPRDVRAASLRPLLPRRWPRGFVTFSANTLLAGLVSSLVFSRSEIFLLDGYGLVGAAGLFALAAGLAGQITAPVDAMISPLIPAAASLVAVNQERAAAAVLRGLRLSGLLCVPLAAVAVPAVTLLIPAIYGGHFSSGAALFVALGAISCLQSVLHPVSAFLAAWRRPLLLLGMNSVSLTLDLGLTAALVPSLGAAGAVIGNSVGQVTSFLIAMFLLRRYLALPVRVSAAPLAPFGCAALAGAAAAVGGLVLVDQGVPVATSAATAVAAAALLAVLGVRAVGGAVTDADLSAVTTAFPRIGGGVERTLHTLAWTR